MVKSAEDWSPDDFAAPLDWPTVQRILFQGQVPSKFVVTGAFGLSLLELCLIDTLEPGLAYWGVSCVPFDLPR
jgi:hypothetical protein